MLRFMPDWIAIVLRPFGALVLLFTAALIAYPLAPMLPRVLTRRHAIVPATQTRLNVWAWRVVLAVIVAACIFKPFR